MARGFNGERFSFSGRDGDIEIDGIGGYAIYRTGLASEISADNFYVGAVIVDDFGDVVGLNLLIARAGHL